MTTNNQKHSLVALAALALSIGSLQAAFINVSENGDGNLTTPSNWSGGVFDSSPTPRGPNFTSTGNLIDTLAGNRTMTLSFGTATHGTLELGATGTNVTGFNLQVTGGTLKVLKNLVINRNQNNTAAAPAIHQSGGSVTIGVELNIGLDASGEASYRISGGNLALAVNMTFTNGLSASTQHSFIIDGQDTPGITVGGHVFADDMDAEATGAVTQYQETLPEPTPGKWFYQVQDVTP